MKIEDRSMKIARALTGWHAWHRVYMHAQVLFAWRGNPASAAAALLALA